MSFKLIAITPEKALPDEAERIKYLLDAGFDYVHLRKPQMSEPDMREYVQSLPGEYRSKLKMHYFLPLAEEFRLGGVHLNGRCQLPPAGYIGQLSRSCHTLTEVSESKGLDYVFLSPIFNSISKQGYLSNFSKTQLKGNTDKKVIALGGITSDKIQWLADVGFGGCAMLGYLFGVDTEEFERRVELTINERNKLK